MEHIAPSRSSVRMQRVLGGIGLMVVAVVIYVFMSSSIHQAFGGPREVTEEDLLAMKEVDSGSDYVSFEPIDRPLDTQLRWGKKDNAGTKYLLLRVDGRLMLGRVRVDDNGPVYVGRLQKITDSTDKEVIERTEPRLPHLKELLLPVMLRTTTGIWIKVILALVFVVGFVVGGAWLILAPVPAPPPRRTIILEE